MSGLVACDKNNDAGDGGPATTCWEQTTRSECELLGDACSFLDGTNHGAYADGMCVDDGPVEVGWCVPTEDFFGTQTGSVWHETATGRVMSLGLDPNSHPPGWEECPFADPTSFESCPSPVEACHACLCQNGGETGTASGSGT